MRKYLVLFFIFLFSTFSFAQKKLTLNQSIQIALQGNSGLIKAKNNLKTNESSVKSAYGDLIPDLGISGAWTWNRNTEIGLSQLNVDTTLTDIDTRSYSVGAGGRVVLFDGLANYARISSSKNELESAEFYLDKFKRDVVLQTSEFYYSILNAEELLIVRHENLKYNQKLLETIQERNRLGSVPIADVYSQQFQTGNAELEVIKSENAVDASKNTLLNYLALDVLEDYEFENPFETIEINNMDKYSSEFSDIKTMVDYALKNRTDYMGQMHTVASSEEGITIAKGGYWPSLSGNYGFTTSTGNINNFFDRKFWSLGLSLNVPIFSNFGTENSVQFAKVRFQNANEDLLALERQIKIEVKQGFLDFNAVTKGLEVAIENVQSSAENRRVQYERYSLGAGTFLDVLLSDRDYQNALSQRVDAEFLFYKTRDALLNYLGKLDYKNYE